MRPLTLDSEASFIALGSSQKLRVTSELSALNGTSALPPPQLSEHHGRVLERI